ncbi:MAG: lipopolysaccharide heptosyltransferase II [Succinivibrio sp.]
MHRILIIAPSWLGDIIMSQALMKALKAQCPSCEITAYAPAYALPVIARMKEVSHAIENPFGHGELLLRKRWSEGRRLRKLGFDTCFVLPNSLKSALVPFFAAIPDRRGFKGEGRFILLNNMRTNKADYPRMADRYVALAYPRDQVRRASDLPKWEFPSLELKKPSEELLSRLGLDFSKPALALGCGASYGPAKIWPAGHFAQVCRWWAGRTGGQCIAFGTKSDAKAAAAVGAALDGATAPHFRNIAGFTKVDEALDLLGMCSAAVCNDSGLMHTAAAAGVPQADIFGSTSATYTPPLSEKAACIESSEPCRPCFERTCPKGTYACLRGISPQRVIEALEEVMG